MTTINDLRAAVARLEADLAAANARVLDAQHKHDLAVRSAVTRSLAGDYCNKAVAAASAALGQAKADRADV